MLSPYTPTTTTPQSIENIPSALRDPLADHALNTTFTTHRQTQSSPCRRIPTLDPRNYMLTGFSRPQTVRKKTPVHPGGKNESGVEMLPPVDCARIGLGLPLLLHHDTEGGDDLGHHHSHEFSEKKNAHGTGSKKEEIYIDAAKLFTLTEGLLREQNEGTITDDVIWEEEAELTELYDGWMEEDGEAEAVKIPSISQKPGGDKFINEGRRKHGDLHQGFMENVKKCVWRGQSAAEIRSKSGAERKASKFLESRSSAECGDAESKKAKREETESRIAALAIPKKKRTPWDKPRPFLADHAPRSTQPPLSRAVSTASVPGTRRPSAAPGIQSRRSSMAPRPSTTSSTMSLHPPRPRPRPVTAPTTSSVTQPPLSRSEALFVLKYLHSTTPFSKSITNRAPTLTDFQNKIAANPTEWNPSLFSVSRFILDYTRLHTRHEVRSRPQRRKSLHAANSQNTHSNLNETLKLTAAGSSSSQPKQRTAPTVELGQQTNSVLDVNERLAATQVLKKPYFERTPDDLRCLFRAVRRVQAFSKLSDFILGQLCGVLGYQIVGSDRAVFRQGDTGSAWYIILSGSVAVQVTRTERIEDSVVVAKLQAGQGFGDLALINDSPRLATIVTLEQCEMAFVEKADYNRIIKFIHEKESMEKVFFLRKVPLFSDWTAASLRSIGQQMTWKKLLPGSVIVSEGQPIEEFYLLRTGTCTVHRSLSLSNGRTVQVKIADLQPLTYFGEMGVLLRDSTESIPLSRVTIRAKQYQSPDTGHPHLTATAASHIVEVAVMKCFDAREKFGTILVPHAFVPDADDALVKKIYDEDMARRKWDRLKRESMVGLVREWSGNPIAVLGGDTGGDIGWKV